MIPGSANPLLLRSAAATGYQIQRSLRFNSSDSAYLSRALTASNRKKWSFSFWFKKTTNSQTDHYILDSSAWTTLTFNNNALGLYDAGAGAYLRLSAQVFRDPSAWYYILVVYDSDNATAQNRLRFYCNGVEITTWQTNTTITSGYETRINGAYTHTIGTALGYPAGTINGYLADIHFIDGQALDPTSFGEFSATTGVWMPKAYTGTYGTNGFKLNFSDNSTTAALGTDSSGQGNTWSVNNISVTAGAGNDSVVDVPTNGSEVDTGAGGEVRGNYATLNPLTGGTSVLSNGNLQVTSTTANQHRYGTIGIASGKFYWEHIFTASGLDGVVGISNNISETGATFNGIRAYVASSGHKYAGTTPSSYGATWTIGDLMGIALDMDSGSLTFYKNGVSQGVAFTGLTGTWFPLHRDGGNATAFINFGQRPFAYTAPSGFKALCTANLPAPVVAKPNTVMDVKLYTGNGSTQTISGLGFSPDLVWIKARNNVGDNVLEDIVRGTNQSLTSNGTSAETTYTGSVTAFNSDGFTLGAQAAWNNASWTFAAWCWDAGTTTSSNGSGSISSQVRANASAGFTIVTYTGTGANATVGHGLGVAPGMVIVKRRNSTGNWQVRHTSIAAANSIQLNLTNAAASATTVWNSTAPSSTVFSVGTDATVNASGGTYVAYCFAPVAGYSSFGSYTGNGSADGPFVYTGFRPRWIMFKCSSTNNGYTFWEIIDTARDNTLAADLSDAEGSYNLGTGQGVDILSNGFKIRGAGSGKNISSATYIYYAVAENPFQYARAR